MEQDLTCKCGNDQFHIGSNNGIAMCSKCHTIYNDKGEELMLNSDIKDKGEVVFFKNFTPMNYKGE